jgi:hypothetical protein
VKQINELGKTGRLRGVEVGVRTICRGKNLVEVPEDKPRANQVLPNSSKLVKENWFEVSRARPINIRDGKLVIRDIGFKPRGKRETAMVAPEAGQNIAIPGRNNAPRGADRGDKIKRSNSRRKE